MTFIREEIVHNHRGILGNRDMQKYDIQKEEDSVSKIFEVCV